jgi:hypothetical protein
MNDWIRAQGFVAVLLLLLGFLVGRFVPTYPQAARLAAKESNALLEAAPKPKTATPAISPRPPGDLDIPSLSASPRSDNAHSPHELELALRTLAREAGRQLPENPETLAEQVDDIRERIRKLERAYGFNVRSADVPALLRVLLRHDDERHDLSRRIDSLRREILEARRERGETEDLNYVLRDPESGILVLLRDGESPALDTLREELQRWTADRDAKVSEYVRWVSSRK